MNSSSVERSGSSCATNRRAHLAAPGALACAAAAVALALGGCMHIDMGPEPSVAVGARGVVPPGPPQYDLKAHTDGAATQPAPASRPGPLSLSVQDAILAALKNNPSLKVQQYEVPISRTREEDQRAVFDPVLTGELSAGRTSIPNNRTAPRTAGSTVSDSINGSIGAQQFLPTGTTVGVDGTVQYGARNFYSDSAIVTRGGLTVTQALLRGADVDANLALLREAQIDTKTSQHQLRAFAETLLSDIEQAYWDYAYARRQMEIVQAALDVAQKQLDQTNDLIKVEKLAPTERAAAEAEVALRREDLINAQSTLRQTRIKLVQLVSSPRDANFAAEVELLDKPFVPEGTLDDVEKHVQIALQRRPEIAQARLQIERGELEVIRTRNGLLPRLDLFVTLGKSGYARAFGSAVANEFDGPGYDALVGVRGEYPLLNRAAKADYRRANLTKEQATESLNNLIQLVQVDVRSAYIEVSRTREQIAATAASRDLQETKARVEEEKLKLGKSTTLLVAQAQRDLLNSQIAEVQARTSHLKALVTLYRLEGTLLDRRYISAPGPR